MDEVTQEVANEVAKEVTLLSHWFESNQDQLIAFGVNFIIAIIIFIVGRMAAGLLSRWLEKLLQVRQVDHTISTFLSLIVRYAVYIFTLIAVLGQLGVQTTSIVAAVGAASLAVGLALQGSLANFAAGVLLILFRPFKLHEYVDIGGAEGTVKTIQIFSTTLLRSDGQLIVIPNAKVLASNILNFTRDPDRRIEIKLPVSSKGDVENIKKMLTQIVEKQPHVLHGKGILVRLSEITFVQTTQVLIFTIRAWTSNGHYSNTQFDLLEAFKKALQENHLEAMPEN